MTTSMIFVDLPPVYRSDGRGFEPLPPELEVLLATGACEKTFTAEVRHLESSRYFGQRSIHNTGSSEVVNVRSGLRLRSRHPSTIMDVTTAASKAQPSTVQHILTEWAHAHFLSPYPSKEDQKALAAACGIHELQVSYWFTNFRKRKWKKVFVGAGHAPAPPGRRSSSTTSITTGRKRVFEE